MIQIQRSIEKEIDKISPKKTIFKGFGLAVVWAIIPLDIIIGLLLYCLFGVDYMYLYMIVLNLFTLLYFFAVVNTYAKKELERKGIKYDKGFFKHWANDEYMCYKYKLVRERLVELKIITQSNFRKNSQLLTEYAESFEKEAEKINTFEPIKIVGSIFLLFLLPIWNQFLGKIFKDSNLNKLDIVFKYIPILSLIILIIIIAVIGIRQFIKGFLESKKQKLNQISKELLNLKWNEDLKIKDNN